MSGIASDSYTDVYANHQADIDVRLAAAHEAANSSIHAGAVDATNLSSVSTRIALRPGSRGRDMTIGYEQ